MAAKPPTIAPAQDKANELNPNQHAPVPDEAPAVGVTPAPHGSSGAAAELDGHDKPPGIELPSADSLGNAFEGTWLESLANPAWIKPILIFGFVGLMVFAIVKAFLQDQARKGQEGTTAGLNYVVGPMGSGKSMFGVRAIVDAVMADKYVITNVRLLPGWSSKVVEKKWGKDWRDPVRRAAAIERLEGWYVYERNLRKAMRFRPPCAVCGGDVRVCCGDDVPIEESHSGPHQEARAVMVWDETHNDLNNREWDAGSVVTREAKAEERKRRALIVTWGTQLRKLGFSGYLLSQHHENTDAQLRRVCNHIIRLQNQRNVESMWFVRLLPRKLTLFLCYWYPAHLADGTAEHRVEPVRRERYWLPWTASLYDSWETFHGIDAHDGEDAPILLPARGYRPAGGAPALAGSPAAISASLDDSTPATSPA